MTIQNRNLILTCKSNALLLLKISCSLNVLEMDLLASEIICVSGCQNSESLRVQPNFSYSHSFICSPMLHCGAKSFTCSLRLQCVYDNYDSLHVERQPSNYMLCANKHIVLLQFIPPPLPNPSSFCLSADIH